ncbi:uncharacterized protein PG986_012883 [Apiospora aurea]|uniref:receptor protein-tyrosine kinase n=1 Tax=Apiospora aurea TaxID=335848 RepID=A0ABR1Q196_9PEZI
MSSSILDSIITVPKLSGNRGGFLRTRTGGAGGAEEEASLPPRAASSSSSPPCPDANNTKIADSQGMEYNLLCGTSIVGSDLGAPAPADSLASCLDLCTKTRGTCAGVTYNGTHCHRKDFVGPSALKSSASLSSAGGGHEDDRSAVAVVPAPSTADCHSLKSCYQSGGDSNKQQQQHGFQIYCGQDYKRDDLSKVFAASMTKCLDACAGAFASQGCVGVAYQSGGRGNGVLNCYLKNGSDTQYLVDGRGYDTSAAFMLSQSTNGGTGKDGSSSSSSSSGSSAAAQPTTTTPPPSPSASPSTGTIAGAVVGGVAGVAVLCLLVFVFMRRRQKRRTGGDNGNTNNYNGGGAVPNPNYFQVPSPSSQHVPPAAPSSSNFSNYPEGYIVTAPSNATTQQQQQQQYFPQPPHHQQQYPYQQQQQPPQKPPETFVRSHYEVDASPRAVEVEAPMDRPTEMADQSVWSSHEPKTLKVRMR